MTRYIVCVKDYTNNNGNTKNSFPHVQQHIKPRTRISSCAERLGYRKKNAPAIAIILRQVVAAGSTPLHKFLQTELYSNESMVPSGITGLVLQQCMLTAQACETERWGVG